MFTNPFVQPQQMLEIWTKATQEQLARMDKMAEQVQSMQGQAVERTKEAIDETARLMKESVAYATALSNEWRKVSLEATKKATEMVTPKA
jgi:predicted transcriptional regulator